MTAGIPWTGDACSLVDAFRRRERSPAEELQATLRAIGSSRLNAFSHVDVEGALAAARTADVSLPFGGLPMAVKELDRVAGWPATDASLVFAGRVADHDSTFVTRLRGAGAVLVGQTTSSEFGGLNVSVSRLHGVTGNAWDPTRTAGGSSGGSATAVAGGLVTLASGSDGGGSIRIPAGFCGLVGMKGTYGRIPRGPSAAMAPNTVVFGCLARSVRDVARYYDVCGGYDSRDPSSLDCPAAWEQGLDGHDLAGARVVVAPTLGQATLLPAVQEAVLDAAAAVIAGGRPHPGRGARRASRARPRVGLGQHGVAAGRPRRALPGGAGRVDHRAAGRPQRRPAGLQPGDGGHAWSGAARRPTRPWPPSSTGPTS